MNLERIHRVNGATLENLHTNNARLTEIIRRLNPNCDDTAKTAVDGCAELKKTEPGHLSNMNDTSNWLHNSVDHQSDLLDQLNKALFEYGDPQPDACEQQGASIRSLNRA